jgi:hypothetical protein
MNALFLKRHFARVCAGNASYKKARESLVEKLGFGAAEPCQQDCKERGSSDS